MWLEPTTFAEFWAVAEKWQCSRRSLAAAAFAGGGGEVIMAPLEQPGVTPSCCMYGPAGLVACGSVKHVSDVLDQLLPLSIVTAIEPGFLYVVTDQAHTQLLAVVRIHSCLDRFLTSSTAGPTAEPCSEARNKSAYVGATKPSSPQNSPTRRLKPARR